MAAGYDGDNDDSSEQEDRLVPVRPSIANHSLLSLSSCRLVCFFYFHLQVNSAVRPPNAQPLPSTLSSISPPLRTSVRPRTARWSRLVEAHGRTATRRPTTRSAMSTMDPSVVAEVNPQGRSAVLLVTTSTAASTKVIAFLISTATALTDIPQIRCANKDLAIVRRLINGTMSGSELSSH